MSGGEDLVVACPHCGSPVIVDELRCGIFRHGVFRDSGLQIDPHATRQQIDGWVERSMIYGCGRPFRVVSVEGRGMVAEVCDYI